MSTSGLLFNTVDVFTTERFHGNPLGIVHIPYGQTLQQEEKQKIAREFNLSETVFLHQPAPGSAEGELQCDIFLVNAEVPWAGHPVIGAAWFIGDKLKHLEKGILRTKAGPVHFTITVDKDGYRRAEVQVPIDIHVHQQYWSTEQLFKFQPQLEPHAKELQSQKFPIVAIVSGVQFSLVRLRSREILSKVEVTGVHPSKLSTLDPGSTGFVGTIFHYIDPEKSTDDVMFVHTRMIEGTFEDPATGSASSALAAWLAEEKWKTDGSRELRIQMEQGRDMGRPSYISLFVSLNAQGTVEKILLSGSATHVMSGQLM